MYLQRKIKDSSKIIDFHHGKVPRNDIISGCTRRYDQTLHRSKIAKNESFLIILFLKSIRINSTIDCATFRQLNVCLDEYFITLFFFDTKKNRHAFRQEIAVKELRNRAHSFRNMAEATKNIQPIEKRCSSRGEPSLQSRGAHQFRGQMLSLSCDHGLHHWTPAPEECYRMS